VALFRHSSAVKHASDKFEFDDTLLYGTVKGKKKEWEDSSRNGLITLPTALY